MNARRQSIGCPKLEWDERIAAVAQNHSRDMVSRNFNSHTNPDGKDPFDRLKEAGIDFSAAAEDITSGPKTGKEAYLIWLNSPSHRENMLNCLYLRHGVGRVRGRWTHVLISPDLNPTPFLNGLKKF
ncbi:MAG: CAP domain-containing protein [Deltaproteobacteria bacterium]|nr:CAP domain-containing protein [Deltaproteobacteria bacterium]